MTISWTPEEAGLKPWEGNGGTFYVNTPAENNAVVSALNDNGYYLSGSNSDKNAIRNAQNEVVQDIQNKINNSIKDDISITDTTQDIQNTISKSNFLPLIIGGIAFYMLIKK